MTSKELIEKVKHCGFEEWRLAIEKIEKELKALEILKNKKTDINLLLNNGLDFYNSCFYPRKLTQEEYELLKEVLEE